MSLPGWEVVDGNSAGSFTGGGNKLVIHTTEGSSANGAIGAYRKNNSWPHFTISYEENRKIQHLEINVAARSLANNTSDGWQTNRADCVQVEVVGRAGEASGWTTAKLDWIAQRFAEIRAAYDFPLQHPKFQLAASRFSDKDFVAYSGIVGHEHVPDNDHWDPGALNVDYIVSKMSGVIPPQYSEGKLVMKSLDFDATVKTDNDGNGYVDVYHGQSTDPIASFCQANGGISNGKYPTYTPLFWCAANDGKFVRVTVVGTKPNSGFTFKIKMDWP